MRLVSFSELCYTNIDFDIKDVFPESWLSRNEFLLYKSKERPCSAFFFVFSDITVTFFSSDGREALTAKNGDVVFIPKDICYRVSVSGETGKKIDTYTVNLNLFDEKRDAVLLSDRIRPIAHVEDNRLELRLKKLSEVFHRCTEMTFGGKYNFSRIKGEFFLLLDLINASAVQSLAFYYPIKKGIEAFREEWNQNEKIEKYARLSGVSETYFYRCFKKWSGKSPIEYRNILRLSNAESLLRSTDIKIKEISETVGFDDAFYFCRLFTEVYGMSPKHYRAHYQKDV